MSEDLSFPVEEWSLREMGFHLDTLAQTESIFALSNGHIGLRGNLDEGEPCGLPGTYLNSFYELRPLPYAEGGCGYPESGQTIINGRDNTISRSLSRRFHQHTMSRPKRAWDQLLLFYQVRKALPFTDNGPESPALLKAGMNGRSLFGA